MNNSISTTETIGNTVQKAKSAQFEFEKYNQAQVDEVVTAVAWSICNPAGHFNFSKTHSSCIWYASYISNQNILNPSIACALLPLLRYIAVFLFILI